MLIFKISINVLLKLNKIKNTKLASAEKNMLKYITERFLNLDLIIILLIKK